MSSMAFANTFQPRRNSNIPLFILFVVLIVGVLGVYAYQSTMATSDVIYEAVVMPQPLSGVPKAPPHIENHPRGDHTSLVKMAAWTLFWNELLNNKHPDWCGQRSSDGAILAVMWEIAVQKTTGGLYKGVSVLLNGTDTTAMAGMRKGDSGPREQRWEGFTPIPCPPRDQFLRLAQ